MDELELGLLVEVVGPTIHGDTFAVGKQTEIAAYWPYEDGNWYNVCKIDGWGYVWFPRASLKPLDE